MSLGYIAVTGSKLAHVLSTLSKYLGLQVSQEVHGEAHEHNMCKHYYNQAVVVVVFQMPLYVCAKTQERMEAETSDKSPISKMGNQEVVQGAAGENHIPFSISAVTSLRDREKVPRAAVFLFPVVRQIPNYPPLPKKYCTNELDLV